MELPNVIFIVVDTLRKDYAKPLEEELKKFGFISYKNAIAPASWTTPSHASIFTGLYPALHGAHETKNKKHLKVKINKRYRETLISEELFRKDYDTYLLTANMFITPHFGFTGFGYIYDTMGMQFHLSSDEKLILDNLKAKYKLRTRYDYVRALIIENQFKLLTKIMFSYFHYIIHKFLTWPTDKGAKNTVRIIQGITKDYNRYPLFIFINLMEVHEPYFRTEGNIDKNFITNLRTGKLDQKLVQKWKEKYPKEIEYVTGKIVEIMSILKGENIFDNSLIIVTSDHGQLLGEHGRISHGTFLYDELLRVPLLVKYPKESDIKIITNSSKYISLTNLKQLILNLVENKLTDDSVLYSDIVFGESFGIHQNVGDLSTEEEKKNIEKLEKYRIAVYYKNFRGIFNVKDWKFEEVISYDPNIEITEDTEKNMKNEVVKFLKTATAVKVPKIKP